MGWVTASSQTPKPRFQSLQGHLLFSYLAVTAAILGTSAIAVYAYFTHNLEQQLNKQLLTLAEAGAPSFNTQLLTLAEAAVASSEGVKIGSIQSLTQVTPWHNLVKRSQSLEWFDAKGNLIAKEGASFPTFPLVRSSRVIQQQDEIRSVTIAVFTNDLNLPRAQQLRGYIRASESTQQEEVMLTRLGLGLSLGGIVALVLSAVGSLWLTGQALKPIKQSFQQLKQFTADASHELRSPLTVIKTSIAVILTHPERTHPLDTKKVAAIASATDQMIHLAENLLFLARTDTVISPLAFKQVVLNEVLEDLVERLTPQAQAKEILLGTCLLTNVSVSVRGSAPQLYRLFSNLLDNALQYTPPGGRVILSTTRRRRFLEVSIQDTGIGIAPEDLPFIFQRFWRADKARSQRVEGLGLGLAIAQTIVQQHRGEITVRSQVGVGSCFQVRLPVA